MKLTFRKVLIITIFAIAIVYLLPTFYPDLWPYKTIKRGLDLQGGMHLVLEVQVEKAIETTIDTTIHEIKNELRDNNLKHLGLTRTTGNKIQIILEGDDNINGFNDIISDKFNNLKVVSTTPLEKKSEIVLMLSAEESKEIKKLATEQALETIRNRIDEFGVSEPEIRIQGTQRILIKLPGVQDPERAKALIGKTAQLTFQLVDEDNNVQIAIQKERAPVGDVIMYEEREDKATKAITKIPYLIKKRILLDGSRLTDARVEFDRFGQPQVGIAFDRKGARRFEKITGENLKKRLAIVLDQKVYSAPVIQSRISGGKATITGNFSLNDARDLAIALRAGSLPAPVKIIEERTVGPTLGADSIRMGLISMMAGGIFVVLFMLIYYKKAGLIADFALISNIILIGGGLAAFQATLTLPGIAGIILTIGMAVDANVIIFERIREELRSGKTPMAAMNSGFEKATLTILDANVTTLIAAIVLFQFGSGAVRGFAVTLSLGIFASLFTALIVSKAIFDFILENKKVIKLSI
ncbi:MAG: protein translocase subunit SecD [Desulfobacterales bacterium]|nr:protein translocase subunit SecD [Desulfobacterales bacterium]